MNVPQELLSRYMENRKHDLESCLINMETKNYSAIEKVGHQLKGNGLTFGHPDLSSIGSHLEVAAKDHDLDKLAKAIEDLSQWVSQQFS